MSFNASIFRIEQKKAIKLVSFQDIRNEIEQEEMESMQELIKVMTHEILNSVSPITLLSSGLINRIEHEGIEDMDRGEEAAKDILHGLAVIKSRSKGLSSFVDDYRSSMQIPVPKFKELTIGYLFLTMETLFAEECNQKDIEIKTSVKNDLKILADQKLIEQVLINLINNAIYFASKSRPPMIILNAEQSGQNILIKVIDNGQE